MSDDAIPSPRQSLDTRTPPSKEDCWEAFWDIWVPALADLVKSGRVNLPTFPLPEPEASHTA